MSILGLENYTKEITTLEFWLLTRMLVKVRWVYMESVDLETRAPLCKLSEHGNYMETIWSFNVPFNIYYRPFGRGLEVLSSI